MPDNGGTAASCSPPREGAAAPAPRSRPPASGDSRARASSSEPPASGDSEGGTPAEAGCRPLAPPRAAAG
eukprot:2920996-Alexandrium_andersonii.AAC.1